MSDSRLRILAAAILLSTPASAGPLTGGAHVSNAVIRVIPALPAAWRARALSDLGSRRLSFKNLSAAIAAPAGETPAALPAAEEFGRTQAAAHLLAEPFERRADVLETAKEQRRAAVRLAALLSVLRKAADSGGLDPDASARLEEALPELDRGYRVALARLSPGGRRSVDRTLRRMAGSPKGQLAPDGTPVDDLNILPDPRGGFSILLTGAQLGALPEGALVRDGLDGHTVKVIGRDMLLADAEGDDPTRYMIPLPSQAVADPRSLERGDLVALRTTGGEHLLQGRVISSRDGKLTIDGGWGPPSYFPFSQIVPGSARRFGGLGLVWDLKSER